MVSAEQEIARISEWCTSHNIKIYPDKASVLLCSLSNHAVKANMPPISIQGRQKPAKSCIWELLSNLLYLMSMSKIQLMEQEKG